MHLYCISVSACVNEALSLVFFSNSGDGGSVSQVAYPSGYKGRSQRPPFLSTVPPTMDLSKGLLVQPLP